MAAGTCLGLFSVIMKDAITVPVVAFIQTAISNPDWHYREAALMAFGCIMEGPSSAQLAPYIQNVRTNLDVVYLTYSFSPRSGDFVLRLTILLHTLLVFWQPEHPSYANVY